MDAGRDSRAIISKLRRIITNRKREASVHIFAYFGFGNSKPGSSKANAETRSCIREMLDLCNSSLSLSRGVC